MSKGKTTLMSLAAISALTNGVSPFDYREFKKCTYPSIGPNPIYIPKKKKKKRV